MRNTTKRGFTLLELVIVTGVLALLGATVIALLNPKQQLDKGYDGKRKQELSTLKQSLEDWYNDKLCYPKPAEICYNAQAGVTTCNVCGSAASSPSFSPYLSQLPCDPQHPQKDLLYEVDNTSCPTWYRIYSHLNVSQDSTIGDIGCTLGCGPGPGYQYQYGVSSPNVDLERNPGGGGPSPTSAPGPTNTPAAGQLYQCGVSCGCGPCGNGYAACTGQTWTTSTCNNKCTPCGMPNP